MKKVIEDEGAGLVSLLGENVTVISTRYIYFGKLTGVNDNVIELDNAHIVYKTGPWGDKKFSDAQKLPFAVFLVIQNIESIGKTNTTA